MGHTLLEVLKLSFSLCYYSTPYFSLPSFTWAGLPILSEVLKAPFFVGLDWFLFFTSKLSNLCTFDKQKYKLYLVQRNRYYTVCIKTTISASVHVLIQQAWRIHISVCCNIILTGLIFQFSLCSMYMQIFFFSLLPLLVVSNFVCLDC